MDDRRFDEITRLAASSSRRQALKALGGSAAGGVLALFGGARRGGAQTGSVDCCPPDKPRLCADRCVNVTTDPNNCGSCGTVCQGNETCQNGVCAKPVRCPRGTTNCNGACVDLTTDENNCGSCGTVCLFGGTCQNGLCVGGGVCEPGQTRQCGTDVGTCEYGTETCQSDGTWGACEGGVGPQPEVCDGLDNDCDGMVDEDFDFLTDANNCGGCGNVCPGGLCVAGSCAAVCGDGICDPNRGEDCSTCPADCGVCCGDGICDPNRGEDCSTCPDDCGPC